LTRRFKWLECAFFKTAETLFWESKKPLKHLKKLISKRCWPAGWNE